MLILTRYKNESIIIEYPNGNKVTIQVLDTGLNTGRIGIDAPKEIVILRSELTKIS